MHADAGHNPTKLATPGERCYPLRGRIHGYPCASNANRSEPFSVNQLLEAVGYETTYHC